LVDRYLVKAHEARLNFAFVTEFKTCPVENNLLCCWMI